MGSSDGKEGRQINESPPSRKVIEKPFAAGKFEVTFSEWDACVADGKCKHNASDSEWGRSTRPVINVSWNDISDEYIPWLSHKARNTYRLLTEVEWEYASRAGTTTPFSTGSRITTVQANFDGAKTYGGSDKGISRSRTIEVGAFFANDFGLHDMHGNVREWTSDCYRDRYSFGPDIGVIRIIPVADRFTGRSRVAPAVCNARVLRGGAWMDSPTLLRSAARYFFCT